jgi:hypothetical protein
VKVVATSIVIFCFVELLGRKLSLLISSLGMGTLFFIIGAILKTHPPPVPVPGQPPVNPPPASKAMAAMLYIYVTFYSMGWGPLPWIYVADIFPTRTRHYGLAVASASQWLWSAFLFLVGMPLTYSPSPCNNCVDFVVSKQTPTIITDLGYKVFFMFGAVNIAGMGLFSMWVFDRCGLLLVWILMNDPPD